MKKLNVLSLFDGMSCGRIALERAGIEVNKYYASELDKYAIKVTQTNWPDNIQLGDVTKWREWSIDWSNIDFLIGGSPCQGFSFAGKQLAFDDPRSKLFFVYVDILNHIKSLNPNVKFMLENVKMKKEHLDVISFVLGVAPVFINSALVSAQNRQRYYWANWDFDQPEDKGITWGDIRERGAPDCHYYTDSGLYWIKRHSERTGKNFRVWGDDEKCQMLEASMFKNYSGQRFFGINDVNGLRYISLLECERAQTVLQYIKPVEIILCSDQVKSFVSAVEKNPKLLKLVSSAESAELKEYVKLASQNMNARQVSTKFIAHQNADMQTQVQTKQCTNTSQDGSSLIVSNVESTTMYKQAGSADNSAIRSVFMDITEGRITHYGKEGLLQIEQSYTERMNGKIALNLFGGEMLRNAKDALSALEMMQTNRHSTSITSFRLSTKNLEQMLTISYLFAKSATGGSTQDTISKETLYLNLIDGYTNHVSNTQRYKMLGNGWTVDVIAHIFKSLNE